MLLLAHRRYRLVRSQSGFHCVINPLTGQSWSQVWRIEAHFVPDDDDPGPPPWQVWEYLRLAINPLAFLQVKHWHELERIDFLADDDGLFFMSLENLIAGRSAPVLDVAVSEFRTIGRDGLNLTLEMEGEVVAPSEEEKAKRPGEHGIPVGEFKLFAALPLSSLVVAVPINSADPLAAAKGIAQRELGLSQIRAGKVKSFDPNRRSRLPGGGSHHEVLLQVGS